MEETRYYKPETIAELADCKVQTIYRHLNQEPSKFPNAFRIGDRKWVIPEDDAIEYLGYDPNRQKVTIV